MRPMTRVSAVAALVLGSATMAPSVAFAAPLISGPYIFLVSSNCQAIVSVVKSSSDQVTGLSVIENPSGQVTGLSLIKGELPPVREVSVIQGAL